jgi:formylglycine-generating enzyme required for sulfatase activity
VISRRNILLAALARKRSGMARIPGGTFRMGADAEALLREFPNAGPGLRSMLLAETPAHPVTVRPFLMDRYEVTNAAFQRFLQARPAYRSQWSGPKLSADDADRPAAFITWDAAAAYAAWAGKRLPTEPEWEFAARGGWADAKYPWGNEEPTPERVNFRPSGLRHAVAVGSYAPNPYGLYDLAGNVWEFCQDAWAPYSDPRATQRDRRVIRGGSYDGDAFNLRVTARDSHKSDNPVAFVGFRCARNA